jgi:hypothetical protein
VQSDEYLESYGPRVHALIERGVAAAKDFDSEALNRVPEPGRWSAGQIFEHMLIAQDLYLPSMEAALRTAPQAGEAEIRHTRLGKMILGAMDKPNVPSPKKMHPSAGPFTEEIVERWVQRHEQIIDLAHRARGMNLGVALVRNPVMPIFRMSLADCFEIFVAHAERHVGQIEALASSQRQANDA